MRREPFLGRASADEGAGRGGSGPWLFMAVVLAAVYAAQIYYGMAFTEAGVLSREAVDAGETRTLFTHMFMHFPILPFGLAHIGFNTAAMMGLGTSVSRATRGGPRAWLVLWAAFVLFGLAGAGGFLLLNEQGAAVGASGAVCGLWGVFARLTPRGVGGWFGRHAVSTTLGFAQMNLVLVVLAFFAGGGVGIAWEAHLGGYLAGFLLAGPILTLAGRARPAFEGPWGPAEPR